MKERMRKQYYCDFCKKSGGSKYHMKIHEKHCTNNPDRECRMCVLLHGGQIAPTKELIAALGSGGDEGLKRLEEASDYCPMCTLSAIRQSGVNDIGEDGPSAGYVSYDYQSDVKRAFDEINEERNSYCQGAIY